jgi:hypothetical protein
VGLNALDLDRAASLADEGGASAAIVESQEDARPEAIAVGSFGRKYWRMAAVGLTLLAGWRMARRGRRQRPSGG